MTIALSTHSISTKIFKIEESLSTSQVKISTSRSVFKIFKRMEKTGCFSALREERRQLVGRVFVDPNNPDVIDRLKAIITLIKKGLVGTSLTGLRGDEKKSLLHQIGPICLSVQDVRGITFLPRALLKVEKESREVFYKSLRLLLMPGLTYEETSQLLKELQSVAHEDREDVARHISKILKNYEMLSQRTDVICKAIRAVKFLPENLRGLLLGVDPNSIVNSFSEFTLIQLILSSHDGSAAACHDFLLSKINQIADPRIAKHYIDGVLINIEFLFLQLDHPLFELAFTAKEYVENQTAIKNPYVLYAHIQDARSTTRLIRPLSNRYFGSTCSLKISSLSRHFSSKVGREDIESRFGSVFTSKDYLDMIQSMNQRVRSLEPSQKNTLLDSVVQSLSNSYRDLYSNLSDDFFSTLLDLASDRALKPSAASMQAIVHFISNQSSQIEDGSFLSARDNVLLKFSESVKDCRVGKEEGVIAFYHQLPAEYKLGVSSSSLVTPNKEKAIDAIYSVVQSLINELISSDSSYMLELTGFTNGIPQLAHHSLYVKNILFPLIGIPHEVSFDFHSMIICDELVQKSPKQIGEIFFKYFTIESLIERLQLAFSSSDPSAGLYVAFSELLQEQISLSEVWDIDESSGSTSLSRRGAFLLLVNADVIKMSP